MQKIEGKEKKKAQTHKAELNLSTSQALIKLSVRRAKQVMAQFWLMR